MLISDVLPAANRPPPLGGGGGTHRRSEQGVGVLTFESHMI